MPILYKKQKAFKPATTISLSFIIIILFGAILLMLPISSKSGEFTPFIDSLFTATSATCVTGLVVFDTFQKWSLFGQIIILLMIQIGGLGLVTFVTFFNIFIGRKLGFRRMQIASESVSADGFNQSKVIVKNIISVSLIVETLGTIILSTAFVPKYGAKGIFKAIFISISAYCNAGFDILGDNQRFTSLTEYYNNPIVLITVMFLIVFGGLGFIVWHDLINYRKTKHLELHSKIVLFTTALLILSGAIIFALLEWNNKNTFAEMTVGNKVVNSFFTSITCRTAGFNTVDFGELNPVSKVFAIMLMYIGAAPGSTGGGIKITTFIVLVMTVVCILRNKDDTIILKRKIEKTAVYKAITIVALSMTIIFGASFILFYQLDGQSVASGINTLFEVVSAFATVGLSTGVTGVLNSLCKLILIFIMFLGRVGPVSVAMFLVIKNANKDTRKQMYPEAKIMVG